MRTSRMELLGGTVPSEKPSTNISVAAPGWNHYGHENVWYQIGEVFVPMIFASAVYFAVALILHVPSAQDIVKLLRPQTRHSINSLLVVEG